MADRRLQRRRQDGPRTPVLSRLREPLALARQRQLHRFELSALAGLQLAGWLLADRRLQRRRQDGPDTVLLSGLRQPLDVARRRQLRRFQLPALAGLQLAVWRLAGWRL